MKREGDFTGEKKRTPEYINRQGENYVLLDEEMFLLSWKWRLWAGENQTVEFSFSPNGVSLNHSPFEWGLGTTYLSLCCFCYDESMVHYRVGEMYWWVRGFSTWCTAPPSTVGDENLPVLPQQMPKVVFPLFFHSFATLRVALQWKFLLLTLMIDWLLRLPRIKSI